MRGLKTQEGSKFERFFQLIQDAAAERGAVFYAFAGDGNDFIQDDIEGEEMMGWLIPYEFVEEFEREWNISNSEQNLERWSDYFLWAEWELANGRIKIHFRSYG